MGTGIEYDEFDEGRHVNYWELDRTLQHDGGETEVGQRRLARNG